MKLAAADDPAWCGCATPTWRRGPTGTTGGPSEAADLAIGLGPVSRSLSWRRALDTPDESRAEYADAVPGWLEELFAASPLQPDS